MDWATLLDGFNYYSDFFTSHPAPVTDMLSARLFPNFVLQFLTNAEEITWFVAAVIVFGIVVLSFLAFWFALLNPLIRRLGRW